MEKGVLEQDKLRASPGSLVLTVVEDVWVYGSTLCWP